jgi:hypothetical protein
MRRGVFRATIKATPVSMGREACFANLAIAILDGAHRKPNGKPFIAATMC